ncbi:hypothetical protein GCM10020258_37700 [Sphingomonas yabuuchiae]
MNMPRHMQVKPAQAANPAVFGSEAGDAVAGVISSLRLPSVDPVLYFSTG